MRKNERKRKKDLRPAEKLVLGDHPWLSRGERDVLSGQKPSVRSLGSLSKREEEVGVAGTSPIEAGIA